MGQGQTSAVDQGAQQFQANCAGCHGADGKGGDKGPAIATLPGVVALSDMELIKIVRDGTAAGMPSFERLGDAEITAVVGYLRTLQGKTAVSDTDKLVGDADAGRVLYFGKAQCSSCHLVNTAGVGQGGFIASELTSYGANHTAAAIKQAIVQPDTPLDPASRVVEVETKTGQKLIGRSAVRGQLQPGVANRGRPLLLSDAEQPGGGELQAIFADAARLRHQADEQGAWMTWSAS